MVNTIITHLNPLEKIEAKKLMKKRKKAVQGTKFRPVKIVKICFKSVRIQEFHF